MDDDEENYYQTGMVYVPREEDIKYKDDRGPADLTRVIEEYEQLLKDSDLFSSSEIASRALDKLSLGDKISLARLILPYLIESILSLSDLFLKFSISAKSLNFSSFKFFFIFII